MLRTRAMREKEEQREMRKYNYTLLRVRFPDGYILQGKGDSSPCLCAPPEALEGTCSVRNWVTGVLNAAGAINHPKTTVG